MSKDKDRVYLSKCVGKLMAFIRLGDKEQAREWAKLLVDYLKKMDLLPPCNQ